MRPKTNGYYGNYFDPDKISFKAGVQVTTLPRKVSTDLPKKENGSFTPYLNHAQPFKQKMYNHSNQKTPSRHNVRFIKDSVDLLEQVFKTRKATDKIVREDARHKSNKDFGNIELGALGYDLNYKK